ncbi:MAG: HlyD family efflux transporter periplasmic adaptor subunit [Eubacteriales bacterium]|nr:HlyD family efflux transporter periplasmic adaptor subunit [Eubacteriales bacterium]
MVKKLLSLLAAALLTFTGSALAEATFEGTVVAGSSVSVSAPFGGTVSSFGLREGSVVHQGDVIADIATTKIYASSAGTVTGVFAQPGDALEDVATRYGAAMYITPESRYQITADIQYAYNQMENKYVNIGESVYISCTTDSGKHTAQGMVTAVDGTSFTVETTSGELMVDETVRIYRSADLSAKSRIGGGDVTRIGDIAVTGSGSLLYLHVKEGETVERGQLLMETVTGSLDGLYASGSQVLSDVDGIVATANVQAGSTVNKGEALITVYPQDSLLMEISISEYELGNVAQGDAVTFTLNYQEGNVTTYHGVVDMISYLSDEDSGEIHYKGYVSFDATDEVRIGMTAAVTVE